MRQTNGVGEYRIGRFPEVIVSAKNRGCSVPGVLLLVKALSKSALAQEAGDGSMLGWPLYRMTLSLCGGRAGLVGHGAAGRAGIAVVGVTEAAAADACGRSLALLHCRITAASHPGSVGAAKFAGVRGGRCSSDNGERA